MQHLPRSLSCAEKRHSHASAKSNFPSRQIMNASTTDPQTLTLPELQQAALDPATLEQLFSDIARCTDVIEVLPKFAAHGRVGDAGLSLEDGRQLLLGGQLRALQIRYVYDGSQWWDTLMSREGQIRLVRIQHGDLAGD
jgi:hypothetical protein